MTIGFECSDKLLYALSKLQDEKFITISDLIEEAILQYYNISIVDLNNSNINKLTSYNKVVSALNNSRTIKEAANELGVSERTIYRKIKEMSIEFDEYNNLYLIKK